MEVPVWMCYQHIIRCSKSVYGLIKFSSHVFKQESPYPNPLPPSLLQSITPTVESAERAAHFQSIQVWLHLRTLLIRT